jgi:uncharacterized protein
MTPGKANCAAIATVMADEEQYICVGVCMADPDTGYCLGCGRPPFDSPVVAETVMVSAVHEPATGDPDNPQ